MHDSGFKVSGTSQGQRGKLVTALTMVLLRTGNHISVPDIPERELSLDVLGNLDMCRLESMGGQRLGSVGNMPSLGRFGGQRLESLGNLESLGKLESFGQRLESFGRTDMSSNSLDGISRQLLGSLGSLPENDPAIKEMLAQAAAQPESSSTAQGAPLGHSPCALMPQMEKQTKSLNCMGK